MLLSAAQPLSVSDTVPLLLAIDPAVVAANEQELLLRYRYRDITAIDSIVRPDDADVVLVRPLHPAEIRACEQQAGYKYDSGERVRNESIRAANAQLGAWGQEQQALVASMADLHAQVGAMEARLADLTDKGERSTVQGELDAVRRKFAELHKQRDHRTPQQVFEALRDDYLDDQPAKKLAVLHMHEGWRQRRAEGICRAAIVAVWTGPTEQFTADARGFPIDLYEPTVDASVARTRLDLLRQLDDIQADIDRALENEANGDALARLLGQQATAARALQVLEQVTGAAAIHEITRHVEEVSRLPKARRTCFASLSEWVAGVSRDRAASAASRA